MIVTVTLQHHIGHYVSRPLLMHWLGTVKQSENMTAATEDGWLKRRFYIKAFDKLAS